MRLCCYYVFHTGLSSKVYPFYTFCDIGGPYFQIIVGFILAAFGEAVLSVAQKQLDITDNIQSVFTQLTVDLDLTSVDCSTAKYKYVCANLLPSTAAKNKWAQSSDAIITACTSVPCVCKYSSRDFRLNN